MATLATQERAEDLELRPVGMVTAKAGQRQFTGEIGTQKSLAEAFATSIPGKNGSLNCPGLRFRV